MSGIDCKRKVRGAVENVKGGDMEVEWIVGNEKQNGGME